MTETDSAGGSHPAQRTLAAYSNKTADRVNNSKDVERRERIKQVEGGPDDTVYYRLNASKQLTAYHEERGCKYLNQTNSTVADGTRESAHRRGRIPCKRCVDGLSEETNEGEREHNCPLCDETVGSIPDHLPCDGVAPLDGGEPA